MTIYEAKKYGGKETLKTTLLLFILLEIIFMFQETKGDFANGILFFIEGQKNIFFLLFLVLCFVTNYILGSLAGIKIILKKADYLLISFLYGLLFTLLILIYHCLVVALLMSIKNVQNPFFTYIYLFNSLLKEFLILIIPNILCWTWAARRMRQKALVA